MLGGTETPAANAVPASSLAVPRPIYQTRISREPASVASGSRTQLAVRAPPEPGIKVTWWRLLNTAVLVVFGVAKSVASFRGNAVISNVFDIILGVVWGVIALWVSTMETESNTAWAWFFQVNRKQEVCRAWKLVLFIIGGVLYFWITVSVTMGPAIAMQISLMLSSNEKLQYFGIQFCLIIFHGIMSNVAGLLFAFGLQYTKPSTKMRLSMRELLKGGIFSAFPPPPRPVGPVDIWY
ncbi:hypothetical protein HYPSUDRAFT_48974 [Hypholoma sublateritium FD-334 SS-4]|uniref:Uncharacterized protein n=1 Tax=Hypholoma sublateritium (strain FD-334 SS-4) TaxID=945553 RepID=A0A0D2N6A0_HYPSF|nr:hypothetical protein HYPSUDRAFT_48974 [Hypholoma sublateritium FD-334 SS-4]